MARSLASFTAAHGGYRLRVRLLPSHVEVGREFRAGSRRMAGLAIHGYFQPYKSQSAQHGGVIALAGNARLAEVVPHEVTHAVLHLLRTVHAEDDERAATLVGLFTAQILGRLDRLGYL